MISRPFFPFVYFCEVLGNSITENIPCHFPSSSQPPQSLSLRNPSGSFAYQLLSPKTIPLGGVLFKRTLGQFSPVVPFLWRNITSSECIPSLFSLSASVTQCFCISQSWDTAQLLCVPCISGGSLIVFRLTLLLPLLSLSKHEAMKEIPWPHSIFPLVITSSSSSLKTLIWPQATWWVKDFKTSFCNPCIVVI